MSLEDLGKMLEETQVRNKKDAERFEALNDKVCQLCESEGEDKRNLFISCSYEIREVVPEAISLAEVPSYVGIRKQDYYLRICKNCRGELLGLLGKWRKEALERRNKKKDSDGHVQELRTEEKEIAVRENGRIVYISQKEWKRRKK